MSNSTSQPEDVQRGVRTVSIPPVPPAIPVMPVQIGYATPMGMAVGEGIWRENNLLVTTPQATLPPFCVKCNKPADGGSIRKTFAWSSPWLLFLILPGVLIYAIVATILQKKATVTVGLCKQHKSRRNLLIMATWILSLGVIAAPIGGAMLDSAMRTKGTFLEIGCAGILVFLIAALITGTKARLLMPKKIDQNFGWFKGCSPEFLERFSSTH